jgi:hypothetical protein
LLSRPDDFAFTAYGTGIILTNAFFGHGCQDFTGLNWSKMAILLAKQQNALGRESAES